MRETKTWPTLYKLTSTGARQMWEIHVDGNRIFTRFGQVGGAIQQTEPTTCMGKNLGRANATNPCEQAMLEAEAQWVKKQKKDYVLDANPKAGDKSDLIEGGILPMLAHKFSEHGDKLKYPCACQPKLDGHRCIAMSTGLWSRTRKLITGVPHILDTYLDITDGGGTPFDGELYNHEYHDRFEQLTHFIRQEEPVEGNEIVQYHVYDIPGKGTFRQRYDTLKQLIGEGRRPYYQVRMVETKWVNDEDELMLAFEDFLSQGYEGAIARSADGLYANKRSYDLLKIKKFDDQEFYVAGVEEGKGKMSGHAIFRCQTPNGVIFRAKMKGSLDSLKIYWNHPELAEGKWLTVQYQGMTKDGVPRFPVALRFRNDA